MISILILLLLISLSISEKIELEYNSLSHLYICNSEEYKKSEWKANFSRMPIWINFNDEAPNSFVISNLKVVGGTDPDKNAVNPFFVLNVNLDAKKGKDNTDEEGNCAYIISNDYAQLLCMVDSKTIYDSLQLKETDNDDIKISFSSTSTNAGNLLNIKFKEYLLVLALFLFI